jgi:predicted NBD/HSP70 family sugar kinase
MTAAETPAVVFDVGGTHFRSALWSAGAGLSEVRRRTSINYLNTPHSDPRELQEALADYIVVEADHLALRLGGPTAKAGISLGAPVNARSGLVLKSGPLWGPLAQPFDLMAALRQRRPDVSWSVANDVTTALLRYVHDCMEEPRVRVLLVTISTGIGARLYDFHRKGVPVDAVHGIQGEIGHIPVDATFRGRRLTFTCDCGGPSHLNAYASGRGLDALLRELWKIKPAGFRASAIAEIGADVDDNARRAAFAAAVRSQDPLALELLDCITKPLAAVFAILLTHDPLIDTLVLTGGVVDALGGAYVESVNRQFLAHGLFQVTERDPDFLMRRLRIAPPDDKGGLIGAGYLVAAAEREIHVFG